MATGSGVRPTLSAGTQRLFFALWPDARVRTALARTAESMHRVLHGRQTRDASLHLTLAFIGDTGVENLPLLMAPRAGVFTPAFTLTLDNWECWARNKIGYAAPSRIPESLRDLEENLHDWLRIAGFAIEHRTFIPHVTLVRDAQCQPMPDEMAPIEWKVKEIALIRSQPAKGGRHYDVLRTWRLQL